MLAPATTAPATRPAATRSVARRSSSSTSASSVVPHGHGRLVLDSRPRSWSRRARPASFARRASIVAAAESDDAPPPSRAKSTLSALDDVLGVDPAAPDPLDDDSYDDDDDEDPVLEVPILWMRAPGAATPGTAQRQGGGLVAGALSESTGDVYAAITVGLPDRATKSQQERGVKGIDLDFCVDTACTTNFILPQVAYGLDMQIVGVAPAGTGATGAIGGGQEMLLGSAKLGGNRDDVDVAVTGLSAAVVPVPAPNTAGILGRSFLNCFGAVEFDWSEGKTGATVCFHESYDFDEGEYEEEYGAATFDMRELPCGLLAVDVTLNGVTMPALVDTGAPQTIVNRAAARVAGIDANAGGFAGAGSESKVGGGNPFSGLVEKLKEGRERALQSRGVMVMGAGGKPERLDRVEGAGVDLKVGGSIPLRCESMLVGELAAFQAGLGLAPSAEGGDDGAPGVILGLDALMSRPRVVMRTQPGQAVIRL